MADPEEHLDTIERVNGATMSLEEFRELYERPAKPVILTGLIDKWPAKEKWTLEVRVFYSKTKIFLKKF